MANQRPPKYKIRKDDLVVIEAGDEKGKTGRVVKVLPQDGKVLVEGINKVKKHVRGNAEQPGRIEEREAPLHISNVALWNEKEQRAVRVGWKTLEDGKRVRVDRKNGEPIDRT